MGKVARAEQVGRAVQDENEIHQDTRDHVDTVQPVEGGRNSAGTAAVRAAREHAAVVEKAISEQWRLQSRAKAETATELFQLGMLDDALLHAIEAAEQDRSNLSAWTLAAAVAQKKGMTVEACSYFQKALALLKAPEFRSSPEAYKNVVLALPNDHWTLRCMLREIIKEAAGSFSSVEQTQPLLDVLIARDFLDEARAVTDDLLGRRPTLEVFAYAIELASRMNYSCAGEFRAYLEATPVSKRSTIEREFANVRRLTVLSRKTIETVRNAVTARFEEWRPLIARELASAAREEANRRGVSGAALGTLALLAVLITGVALFGKHHAVGIGVSCIVAAMIAAHVERTIKRDLICRRTLKLYCTRESQAWINADPIKAPVTGTFWRSAAASTSAIIVVVLLAYVGSWQVHAAKATEQRRPSGRSATQGHTARSAEQTPEPIRSQEVPRSDPPVVLAAKLPHAERPLQQVEKPIVKPAPEKANVASQPQDGATGMTYFVTLKGFEQCSGPVDLASKAPAACQGEKKCTYTVDAPEGTLYRLDDGTEGPISADALMGKTGAVCFKGPGGQNVTIVYSAAEAQRLQ